MVRGPHRMRIHSRLAALGGSALITAVALMSVAAGSLLAAATPALYAGASTSPNEWTNPANAVGSTAGNYMTAVGDSDQRFRNFGISIPAGSIIDGLTVTVRASSTDNSGCDLQVRLSGNAAGDWTSYKTADLTQTETDYVFGGATDLWGWTSPDWDPISLSNGQFRLEIRNEDPGSSCSNSATTSVDWVTVAVEYRTIDAGTANGPLSARDCGKADFNFVIDMSGSIAAQSGLPENLTALKAGISGFVNAFQDAGGDGIYSGTRFNGSSATALTTGYDSAASFLGTVAALTGPTGATPTAAGITTGAANNSGDRAGVVNIMFVLTDGSPNVPNGGVSTGDPNAWLTAANAAVAAANAARADYVVKAVYLSTPQDPGDTGLPFSAAGDAQWAPAVMTQIGGGSYLDADFGSFAAELFEEIGCAAPLMVDVTKTADPTSVQEPGGPVTFTVDVHNTSDRAVTLASLTDSVYGDLNGQGNCATGGSIASGATYSCQFTKNITGDAGAQHVNIATAVVTDGDEEAFDNDNATVNVTDALPTVSIVKTATPSSRAEPGGVFTYTLKITNTSIEDVVITALSDDKATLSAECLGLIGDTLTPGQMVECSFTDTHVEAGGYTNTASVTVQDNEQNSASDNDNATVNVTDALPTVSIVKTATPSSRAEPGGVFTYTLKITNTSIEDVVITALSDDKATLSAECLGLIGDTLTPGQMVECSFTDTHVEAGGYTNTASVTVQDNEQNSASDNDNATVNVTDALPTVSIVKTADSERAALNRVECSPTRSRSPTPRSRMSSSRPCPTTRPRSAPSASA